MTTRGGFFGVFLIFISICSFPVLADVSGSLAISLLMLPESQTPDREAITYKIDLQTNLQVRTTISGITLGSDLGFGTTGVEFAILSFRANLGAFNIFDEFVFATPFARSGNDTVPTRNENGDLNGATFVKKRVRIDTNVAGFTFTNLAIFEDVDFPRPSDTDLLYNVGQVNSIVGDQTPTYGFGDLITISGVTQGGLRLVSQTGLCIIRSANLIKKRAWPESVNPACTAFGGNLLPQPIEDGKKTPLFFDFETLALRGLTIGGINMGLSTTWEPDVPLRGTLSLRFGLLDLVNVSTSIRFSNLVVLSVRSITYQITSDNLRIVLIDTGFDFSIDAIISTFNFTLNPNQNPAFLSSSTTLTRASGLSGQNFTMSVSRGPFSWSSNTSFSGFGGEGVEGIQWRSTSFSMSVRLADGAVGPLISISLSFSAAGIRSLSINIRTNF